MSFDVTQHSFSIENSSMHAAPPLEFMHEAPPLEIMHAVPPFNIMHAAPPFDTTQTYLHLRRTMPPNNQPCKGKGTQSANANHKNKQKQAARRKTGSKKKDDEQTVKIWVSREAHEHGVSCKSYNTL